jgi:diguanylate cyclase (GGDEF)-like protein/PAS domain S-box-containing protein
MAITYDTDARAGDEPHKRPLVLVIDDDPGARRAIGRAATREGLEVASAEDGEAGLLAFDQRLPQAILLDVQMPGLSGFQVCEEIRRRPGGAEVPIVMMTGHDDEDSIRRAYDVGATDFLTKPIQALILQHRLRYLLRASVSMAALVRSERQLGNALELARMGSWRLAIQDGEFSISRQLVDLLGQDPSLHFTVERFAEQVVEEDRPILHEGVRECMMHGRTVGLDHRIRRPDGVERVMHCQIRLTHDEEGEPEALEGIAQDVTERRQTEEQVQYLALHDELTGLGNRKLFEQRLFLAVHDARRRGTPLAVLVVDLDHFKRVNDSLGHSAGDRLIRGTADRLTDCLRETTSLGPSLERTTAARLGGDSFIILLPEIGDPAVLDSLARRISESLAAPFLLNDHEVSVGTSIGISVFPGDGSDVETLLRNADAAMSHAKGQGRSNHQFYNETMNSVVLARLIIESKLRRALDNNEFEVHYQPKLSLATGKIVGFEGLLRWFDAELGMVMPADFISIAEETGLIVPIGEWVLREACRQSNQWRDQGIDVPIAVNFSPEQFRHDDIPATVRRVLGEEGTPASSIGVEITESVVLHDAERAVGQLEQLREMGLEIALDDFGTGYSSLSYLRTLPVDEVKIDRSFISEISNHEHGSELTASIIQMAQALGLRVIAEGVETEAQRDLLASWGCDQIQGYWYSKPIPADAAARLWRENASD